MIHSKSTRLIYVMVTSRNTRLRWVSDNHWFCLVLFLCWKQSDWWWYFYFISSNPKQFLFSHEDAIYYITYHTLVAPNIMFIIFIETIFLICLMLFLPSQTQNICTILALHFNKPYNYCSYSGCHARYDKANLQQQFKNAERRFSIFHIAPKKN